MIPVAGYDQILYELTQRFNEDARTVIMVALLFARPAVPLVRAEILPNLGHFHYRYGKNFHVFCVGYRDFRDGSMIARDILNNPEYFDERAFIECTKQIERHCNWTYSGETDMLLMNAVGDDRRAKLDFSNVIDCPLEQMIRDGAIKSVNSFFTQIVRFVEKSDVDDPTWGFSNDMGLKVGGAGLLQVALGALPLEIGKQARKAAYFAIANVSAKSMD